MAQNPFLLLTLIVIASLVLVAAGWKKTPGIGILIALLLAVSWVGLGGWDLSVLGFVSVQNWSNLIAFSLLAGAAIALAEVALLEPLAVFLTRQPVDKSVVAGIRGDFRALGLWLLLVWMVVALVEEIIVRGFLLQGILLLIGEDWVGVILAILITSVVFGLAHGYQGASGGISTGSVSLILGWLFVASGRNLWLVILTHGFIDTVGLTLIYFNLDVQINTLMERIGVKGLRSK